VPGGLAGGGRDRGDGAQVSPGRFGAEPFGVVPGGDQAQGGGVRTGAVQGEQAEEVPGDQGTMSAPGEAIWLPGNSVRRPSSRSAIRVWQPITAPGRGAGRPGR
jgi:hypothetical protein